MKKCSLLIVLVFMVMITGCQKSSNKLVCSKISTENNVGYTVETKVTGKISDDVVSGVDLTIIMSFEDEERAKESYEAISKGTSDDNVKVTLNGKMIRVTETEEFEKTLTKDEFIYTYQADGYMCE